MTKAKTRNPFAVRDLFYYGKDRHKAPRPLSRWKATALLFAFTFWLALAWVLFRLVWLFHTLLYPTHQLRVYMSHSPDPWPMYFMMLAPLIGAIGISFMLANCLMWLIPPARRAMDAEAGNNPRLNFRGSMRGLFPFSAWTLGIGMAVALIAACFLKDLP